MANMTMNLQPEITRKYLLREYELIKDVMNNVNNQIGKNIRFNIILQAIQEYKQIEPSLRISNEKDGIRITNERGGYRYIIFSSICNSSIIYLSEKTDPNWKNFIRILNKKFYEGRNMYNAYLEKVKELCKYNNLCDCCGKSKIILNNTEICNCWCNCGELYRECDCGREDDLKIKLLVKALPLNDYAEKVEYITSTKMMLKGKEINSNKSRIFRNTQAIVYCDITGHYFRENYEENNYLSEICDGLIEFNIELKELNDILKNELIDNMPYLNKTPDYGECCVCYEVVNTKTKRCSHNLCNNCVNRLKRKECPMCRGRL
jgi:hypothetical protein